MIKLRKAEGFPLQKQHNIKSERMIIMSNNEKKDLVHEVNVAAPLYSFNTDTKKEEDAHAHPAEDTLERELTDISLLYNLENK